MHQAISPEILRAHERLSEQTELFINQGGHIESVPSGVSGLSSGKPKVVWSNSHTAKPMHKR
ncbi:hypothetical protein [Pseudomonas sp.]|uniref:hypothetical protein n=1 Tax=Pseudomonas sp. TaxID=306 RepID=UPI003C7715F0